MKRPPPKVLHVTQATGGVETSLLLLFKHLDASRYELHLACPPGTSLARAARALGVRVTEIPMVRSAHPIRDPMALASLAALIRREGYAIVHGHSAKGGYLARVAARLVSRAKTIYHPRAFSYLSQQGLARSFFFGLERLAVPLTDLVIATSESERRRAVGDVGFEDARVTVIPNSVDFSQAEGWASVSSNGATVLTVGRLSFQKNPQMFVRVASRVAQRRQDAKFVMIGAGFAGPLESRVRDAVRAAGLEDRFQILPWRSQEETFEAMARCAVFVLTSRFEGMPNTLLEALMLGRPAVVTDSDGSRDVLENGLGGRTVPLDDDAAMAREIVRLLEQPDEARRLGAAGQARARERFDIRKNVVALDAAYGALLGRGAAA